MKDRQKKDEVKLESSKFEWEESQQKHRNKYKWQIRKTQVHTESL